MINKEQLLEKYTDKNGIIDWLEISATKGLSEEFIREFQDEVDWSYISLYQVLGEDFIRELSNKVDWYCIGRHQVLREDFIREFQDKVDWEDISIKQALSEDFIREFKDEVDWYYISMNQKLSEEFIREFQDRVRWKCISRYQKLSEEFIREFQDRVDWFWVSANQILSEEFIREFKDKVNLELVVNYQVLSKEFLEEFDLQRKDNFQDLTTTDKKQLLLDLNMYECHDDYFIAYKGIRRDNYSCFNFQYQYFAGEVYTCHSDYSNKQNSFGLSAWTYDKAKEYCSQKVIKVKINYEDISRVVHQGSKIRCCKFEVLEEVE